MLQSVYRRLSLVSARAAALPIAMNRPDRELSFLTKRPAQYSDRTQLRRDLRKHPAKAVDVLV